MELEVKIVERISSKFSKEIWNCWTCCLATRTSYDLP